MKVHNLRIEVGIPTEELLLASYAERHTIEVFCSFLAACMLPYAKIFCFFSNIYYTRKLNKEATNA